MLLVKLTGPDKSRIVEEGNYHKFTKSKENQHLTDLLLATGDRELVEVWLIGRNELHADSDRPVQQIVSGEWALVRVMQRSTDPTGERIVLERR